MTLGCPIHYNDREGAAQTVLRWTIAGVCVASIYGGSVYAALNWPSEPVAPADPPAAIMIELAPVPVAPDTPQQEVALNVPMEQSQAATPSEQEDKPNEEPTHEVKPEVKTEVEVEPLPEKEKADAVLAQATPPQQEKPVEEKKKPDKPKKAQRKPQDRKAKDAPETAAPRAAEAQRAAVNAAAMAGMSSSVSPASWRSMMMSHLNRHKRMPTGGTRGTATVAFTIDRSGRVVSARLASSSGDAVLDQEAVATVRRASPVPAPPANIGGRGGGNILLAVPIRFAD